MSFAAVIGHTAQRRLLSRLVVRGHVPHALLFAGVLGCGRRTIASALAKALLCAQAIDGDACGSCVSCKQLEMGTHPDFTHVQVDDLGRDIPVDVIREQITEQANLSPLLSARRVFLLPAIERLHSAAANTLLKVLEEPPAGTFLFMTTANEAGILKTIRSRVQLIRLAPLGADDIEDILKRQGIDNDAARQIAATSQGGIRSQKSNAYPVPLASLLSLCNDGLNLAEVAAVLSALPQRLPTDSDEGLTLAGMQRHVLSSWFDQLIGELRSELRHEDTNRSNVAARAIERVLRLQGDLQRHFSPQIVCEGLALSTQ